MGTAYYKATKSTGQVGTVYKTTKPEVRWELFIRLQLFTQLQDLHQVYDSLY